MINTYNSFEKVSEFIKQFDFLDEVIIYNKPGVLTELWLTNPDNEKLKLFDYILFMLDDVKIMNLNIHHMIEIKKENNIEVLSPKVIGSQYRFMKTNSNDWKKTYFLEVFCLLLTYNDFIKFSSMHTIQNKWMWGVDSLYGYYNVEAGIFYKYKVKHFFRDSNGGDAKRCMKRYFILNKKALAFRNMTPAARSLLLGDVAKWPIRKK